MTACDRAIEGCGAILGLPYSSRTRSGVRIKDDPARATLAAFGPTLEGGEVCGALFPLGLGYCEQFCSPSPAGWRSPALPSSWPSMALRAPVTQATSTLRT